MLAPMGLRLSEEKTHLTHIDDGFDFLGWRIQRRTWQGRGGLERTVYIYPSKKSLASIKAKIRLLTRRNAHRSQTSASAQPGDQGAGATIFGMGYPSGRFPTSTTSPSGGLSAG